MGTTQITAEPGQPQIVITRDFDAPKDLLFRAHIDPDLLKQWLGPRRLTTIVEQFDVRDGGIWRFIQKDTDGSEYGFHGVFHGTPSPDGIVQTFEFEGAPGHVSMETLTFEELDGGRTRVHVNDIFQSVADRDAAIQSGMEYGVNEGYERLDELVARVTATR